MYQCNSRWGILYRSGILSSVFETSSMSVKMDFPLWVYNRVALRIPYKTKLQSPERSGACKHWPGTCSSSVWRYCLTCRKQLARSIGSIHCLTHESYYLSTAFNLECCSGRENDARFPVFLKTKHRRLCFSFDVDCRRSRGQCSFPSLLVCLARSRFQSSMILANNPILIYFQ